MFRVITAVVALSIVAACGMEIPEDEGILGVWENEDRDGAIVIYPEGENQIRIDVWDESDEMCYKDFVYSVRNHDPDYDPRYSRTTYHNELGRQSEVIIEAPPSYLEIRVFFGMHYVKDYARPARLGTDVKTLLATRFDRSGREVERRGPKCLTVAAVRDLGEQTGTVRASSATPHPYYEALRLELKRAMREQESYYMKNQVYGRMSGWRAADPDVSVRWNSAGPHGYAVTASYRSVPGGCGVWVGEHMELELPDGTALNGTRESEGKIVCQ